MLKRIKYITLFLSASIVASCQTPIDKELEKTSGIETQNESIKKVVDVSIRKDTTSYIYSWQNEYNYSNALINEIVTPKGYERIIFNKTSFASWLRHLPLKIDNTVYLFNGKEKNNQSAQFKVLDIDVGNKDLQQCADAVMRLRAEYLFAIGAHGDIHFNYTNGVTIPFSKWSSGYYPSLKGNKVVWTTSSNNKSYDSFKKYMTNIFMYAGTSSLEKELANISLSDIEPGDVFIKGGFPGHAVTVLDVAMNKKTNDKIFLIAQSYMPAQSIHILKNPNNINLSPWYSVNDIKDVIETPEWIFYTSQLKRFKE